MTNGRLEDRTEAKAEVVVKDSRVHPFDDSAYPLLKLIEIDEVFRGDIEGRSSVRALQIAHESGFATMRSVQRVEGALHGRTGSFVLEGSQEVDGKKISATWSVVAGSGTGQLEGLRGQGGFNGEFGKGSDAVLTYWFERESS